MILAYNQIIEYEEDNWEDFFSKICLIDIFKELILKYGKDKQELRSFIRYIIWSYSKNSDKVILGDDWRENKKRIFDAAGFKPVKELLDATVNLQDDVVLKTIQKWLTYQDNNVFSQLCVLKDLQQEMQLSANSPIKKSSGEIDYDQKYKNACYVGDLRKMIMDLEDELIQMTPKLKDAIKDVRQSINKKNTKSVEQIMVSDG